MDNKERIRQIMANIPEEAHRFVRKSIDIADRISIILEQQGKTQKDLAQALGKSESEISKWLGGQHNFTIRTLTAVEAALGENIFVVPGGKRHRHYYPEAGTPDEPDMVNLARLHWATEATRVPPGAARKAGHYVLRDSEVIEVCTIFA